MPVDPAAGLPLVARKLTQLAVLRADGQVTCYTVRGRIEGVRRTFQEPWPTDAGTPPGFEPALAAVLARLQAACAARADHGELKIHIAVTAGLPSPRLSFEDYERAGSGDGAAA